MQKLLVSLGLCVAVAACGKESINRGELGETCTSHNDCAKSLACYNGICSVPEPAAETDDGGTVTPPATGPVLSKAGESCTKRADCETGLLCINQTCMTSAPSVDAAVSPPVDASVPTTNTSPGIRGETCTANDDCSPGLVCIPNPTNQSIGVCDLAKYGIVQSGKICSAECKVDIDCCELPIGEVGTTGDGGAVNYNSCADLRKILNQADPSGCEAEGATPVALSKECFLYKTYCDCATSIPWKCDVATGSCAYVKNCTGSGEKIKGCPVQTRTGAPTISTCNAATNTCSMSARLGCKTNDDCIGANIADIPAEKCVSGECVCAVDQGACYRKCNVNLDCAQNYTCDTTKFVCTFAGECTTDLACAQRLGDVTAVCAKTTHTCKKPCAIDQDCGPSGVAGTKFKNFVCGVDGFCADITGQCTTDDDCAVTAASGQLVKMFCAAATSTASVSYASAITATK
jgi:hypothetical protein